MSKNARYRCASDDAHFFGVFELVEIDAVALLDIPDHFGLEQLSMLAQQHRLLHEEVVDAQRDETFMQAGEVRMCLFHGRAELGETLGRLAGDGRDLVIRHW